MGTLSLYVEGKTLLCEFHFERDVFISGYNKLNKEKLFLPTSLELLLDDFIAQRRETESIFASMENHLLRLDEEDSYFCVENIMQDIQKSTPLTLRFFLKGFLFLLAERYVCRSMNESDISFKQMAKSIDALEAKIKQFIYYCLDADQFAGYSMEQRYLQYIQAGNSPLLIEPSVFQFVPQESSEDAKLLAPLLERPNDIPSITEADIKKLPCKMVDYTEIKGLRCLHQPLDYVLLYLMRNHTPYKLCKNCGQYFHPDALNVDYCDRVYETTGKRCSEIGSTLVFQEKTKSDPVYNPYMKAYKRYFARIKKGRLDKDVFEKWATEAREKRQLCANGKIQIEKYKEWLALGPIND